MKRFLPRAALVSSLMLLQVFFAAADDRRLSSAGADFSFTGIGLSCRLKGPEKTFHELLLDADLCGVLQGDSRSPGVRFSYVRGFSFAVSEHDDFTLRWHAGPGVTAGYARDRGASEYGLIAGICGSIGVEFAFRVPVSISVSLMPALATHVRSENGTMKMYLYVNGLVQGLSPRLGIRWRF